MQQMKNAIGWNAMKLLKMHQNAIVCTGMRMGKNYTTFGKKLHYSRPCRWVASTVLMLGVARKLKEAVLASLAWICHVEQLYIDAALVLDASTRVAAAAGSCLIDPHMHCVDDSALESKSATTMLGQARKLTLR
jgi:hypothetical protein